MRPAPARAPADGQVEFGGTGAYNRPPAPVAPLQATWVVVDETGERTGAVRIKR
ncbi:MAG: hypothetical protein WB762_07955 [Candidatus Sulfotelmatobacter sp.]